MRSITGGIPVGGNLGAIAGGLSFPIGSGTSDKKEEEQFKEMFKAPGSWRQYIQDYQRNTPNPLQRQMPSANIGNVGGLIAQSYPMYGDTINMGPAEGDYSNMPVIPDAQEEIYQRDLLMDEFRNRAFPRPYQEYTSPGQYFAQNTPLIGIGGKTVSWAAKL